MSKRNLCFRFLVVFLIITIIFEFSCSSVYAISEEVESIYYELKSKKVETKSALGDDAVYPDLEITSNYTLEQIIEVENLTLTSGTLDLNQNVIIVHGDIIMNGGTLNFNKGVLDCYGDFTLNKGNILMQNINDALLVSGNFNWNYTSYFNNNAFTAGTIEVGGDFLINSNITYFITSNLHKIILNGTKKQIVYMNLYPHKINILELENNSSEGIFSENPINAESIILNNTKLSYGIDISNDTIYQNCGHILEKDEIIDDNFYFIDGILDLNGKTLMVNGNLIQAGGIVKVNNGNLIVNGDYKMNTISKADNTGISYSNRSTGILEMTKENDNVVVNGSFVTYSNKDHTNKLTNGTLEVKGDFYQYNTNSSYNFAASGNHKVILSGDTKQTVYFASTDSYFSKLELTNTSESGVYFSSSSQRIYIKTSVKNENTKTSGYLDLYTGAIVENGIYNGDIRFLNNYTLQDDLIIKGDVYAYSSSVISLNSKKLTVEGNITIYTGKLNIDKGELICNGNFFIDYQSAGYDSELNMRYPEDKVLVKGNYTTDSRYNSALTAGTLEIQGNFYQKGSNNFVASGTHRTLFSGTSKQIVSFSNVNSCFNIFETTNKSAEGIHCTNGLNANEVISNNNKITFEGGGVFGWTLEEDQVIGEDLYLVSGTLNLNGKTLTVNGDLIQAGGIVKVNNGKLIVNGDYKLNTISKSDNTGISYSNKSTGILEMLEENDNVIINGSFVTYSNKDHTNKLTNGTLDVKGDFYQYNTNSSYNFAASGNHKVILSGDTKQTVCFASKYSKFRNLTINNTESLEVNSDIYVNGVLEDNCGNITKNYNFYISTVSQIYNSYFSGNIYLSSSNTLNNDLTIGGSLYTNQNFDLNGFKLDVKNLYVSGGIFNINSGNLYCKNNFSLSSSSYLKMVNEDDYVLVCGDFSTSSGYNHNNYLTNGLLEIRGDFKQTSGSLYNFYASGNHTTLLSGKAGTAGRNYIQSVYFTNIGYSRFNKLIITKPVEKYNINTDILNICVELIEDIRDYENPSKVEGLAITDLQTT